ncbi:ATPase [Oxyplasma meridianum]|uniref:ATPase n=1 Tax=Oxyplasma meridianum TaxID=3073602 RepID=A0AAX4NHD2_9ARCH
MGDESLFGRINEFFSQSRGRSLVVKGKPGAGKTTFALEFLESVRKNSPVAYLSSRSSDASLYETFKWLESVSIKDKDTTADELVNVNTESLSKLERMIEEGKMGTSIEGNLVLNIQDLLPEIKLIYNFVDKNFNGNPIIVVDSIDAIAEKYEINENVLFSLLNTDLVEKSGANIIVIIEAKEKPKLEYFADGVISMDYYLKNDFLVRTATIEKLRGISISSSPIFLYSLYEGRFMPLDRGPVIYPNSKVKMPKTEYSDLLQVPLGSSELTKINPTGEEGVPLGSLIILHREDESTGVNDIVNLMKNNMVRNAISQNRGVMDVTSGSYESSRVLTASMENKYLKNYITAEKSKKINSFIINLEGKSIAEDFPNEVVDFFLSNSSRPNLYFFSTDFLIFTYGNEFFGDLLNLINGLRPTGAILIITDDDYYKRISHYASLTIHFREANGYVLVNSSNRKLYAATTEYDDEGWPTMKLSEIV